MMTEFEQKMVDLVNRYIADEKDREIEARSIRFLDYKVQLIAAALQSPFCALGLDETTSNNDYLLHVFEVANRALKGIHDGK